ncbi:hypothetical protein ABXW19_12245, partial [Streptococcus suis]|uniref:hypothetical protein n=1 Tax=Streptococcus suis TaxID=1307 RepID=UPI003CEFE421
VIIVGRGIYGPLLESGAATAKEQAMAQVQKNAQTYQEAGWKAYEARIASSTTSSSSSTQSESK